MNNNKYEDVLIDEVHFLDGCVVILWSSDSIGYGQVTVKQNMVIDNECMSNEFTKHILNKLTEYILEKSK